MPSQGPPPIPPTSSGMGSSQEPPVDRSVLGEWVGDDHATLDSMLAEFRDSIRADHASMLAALARDDLAEYGMAIHRLRGAALSMGARPLARAAAVMDIAARAKDTAGFRAGIPDLEEQLRLLLAHVR